MHSCYTGKGHKGQQHGAKSNVKTLCFHSGYAYRTSLLLYLAGEIAVGGESAHETEGRGNQKPLKWKYCSFSKRVMDVLSPDSALVSLPSPTIPAVE